MAGEHVATNNRSTSATLVERRFARSAAVVQHVCVLAIEMPPPCAVPLRELITKIRIGKFADGLLCDVKTLHYLSMTIFEDQNFDPTFVLEANFDGPAGPFWADLESVIGPQLRGILRFCKRPNDQLGAKFDAVTSPDSQAPIAPLLEALAVSPIAVHQGTRGTSRAQIEQESQLFADVQAALRDPSPYCGKSATEIHQALRESLLRNHIGLPPRATLPPWRWDLFKLLLSTALLILALNVPGVLLAGIISLFVTKNALLWATAILWVAIVAFIWHLRRDLSDLASDIKAPGKTEPFQVATLLAPLFALAVAEGFLVAVVVLLRLGFDAFERIRAALEAKAPILRSLFDQPKHIWAALKAIGQGQPISKYLPHIHFPFEYISFGLHLVPVGALGAVVTALFVLRGLRALEQQDSSQHPPDVDSLAERKIASLEDQGGQNHMSGLVHIRPGSLRSVLMRVGLNGLGLAIRANPTSAVGGYLVTVRTIHFAHLTLVSNGARLLFLANFDGTWNNYLVDFIEKVHSWLTLVWTNGLGFPPTRFFVFEGATHGQLFTSWQRLSMAPTLYWFRAYPKLSVEQIRRQSRIAAGLREPFLKQKEAEAWALDL